MVNLGNAKTCDMIALIDLAKTTIFEKFAVELVAEVEIVDVESVIK